jgi:hypothetical protein
MPSGKCKRTGAKTKGTRVNKRGRVAKFSRRHIDQARRPAHIFLVHYTHNMSSPAMPFMQVWEDVRKEGGVHDGKVGPLGSADR